jgi:hypothetical protein
MELSIAISREFHSQNAYIKQPIVQNLYRLCEYVGWHWSILKTKASTIFSLNFVGMKFCSFVKNIILCFYLFRSSDQTNNGSEISDPDAV